MSQEEEKALKQGWQAVETVDLEPMLAAVGADSKISASESESLVIALDDLLPDAEGAVVFYAAEDLPVQIHADHLLKAQGVADAHVTAGGLEVAGLNFYSFENGVTLYSPTDLSITAGEHL